MALNKRRDAEMEELIQRGAAELKRLNPHIGEEPQPYSEEELRELEEMDAELERLWKSPEGRRAQRLGYTAAQTVSEDRGE